MSATYDPELPAALDRMRFLLGDTTVDPEEAALVPDETYGAFLTLLGEPLATATLAEGLAARFAQEPGSVSVGGKTISWADRVRTWLELASRFRRDAALAAAAASAIEVGWINLDFLEPAAVEDQA